MGRQVGAAMVNDLGHVLAVGSNEVPRAGGGSYWERESPDFRVGKRVEIVRMSSGELA
jgi:deoxycytidylate deaminase